MLLPATILSSLESQAPPHCTPAHAQRAALRATCASRPQEVFYRLSPARVAQLLSPEARDDPLRSAARHRPGVDHRRQAPADQSRLSPLSPLLQIPLMAKEISLDVFPKWAVGFAEGRVLAGALPGHLKALVEAFEARFLEGFTRALQENVRLLPVAPPARLHFALNPSVAFVAAMDLVVAREFVYSAVVVVTVAACLLQINKVLDLKELVVMSMVSDKRLVVEMFWKCGKKELEFLVDSGLWCATTLRHRCRCCCCACPRRLGHPSCVLARPVAARWALAPSCSWLLMSARCAELCCAPPPGSASSSESSRW